jgi:hypothetical protein
MSPTSLFEHFKPLSHTLPIQARSNSRIHLQRYSEGSSVVNFFGQSFIQSQTRLKRIIHSLFQGCVEVSESGKGYSDYAQNLSNVMNGMLFFAGFTFTVVTILLTSLQNPKALQTEFILLFFTAIFYLTVSIAFFFLIRVTFFIEMPPLMKHGMMLNALIFLTFLLIGLTFPLLFLLWDLTLLAAVSGLMWVVFGTSIFLFVFKRKIEIDRKRRADIGVSDKIQE